jgi:hypothetical protein
MITMQDAVQKYGKIENGVWLQSAKFCGFVVMPHFISDFWRVQGGPVNHIWCNIDMHKPLIQAMNNIHDRGCAMHLKTFDGCFNVRDRRGLPGHLSWHAYALAIDINAETNPLGGPGDMNPDLVACFKDAGFQWGGDFHRPDPMHFQFGMD